MDFIPNGRRPLREQKEQILASLDLEAEFFALGVRFAKGRVDSDGWRSCHAMDRDDRNPSAAVNLKSGYYKSFGDGDEKLSFFDFAVKYGKLGDFASVFKHYAEKVGLTNGNGHKTNGHAKQTFATFKAAVQWVGASRTVEGEEDGVWTYHRPDGTEALRMVRFKTAKGKTYRPFHQDKTGQWVCSDPPGPLPLFNLDRLESRPDETVWIGEGEKVCDSATALGLLATTTAHGAQSPEKSDLGPLAGRHVVMMPDHDKPGEGYAAKILGLLGRLSPRPSVKVLRLPDLDDGGDLVDWIDGQPDSWDDVDCRGELERLAAGLPEWDFDQAEKGPENPTEAPPFTLGLIDSEAFFSTKYELRWLVENVLVAFQPCIAGGPKKALKTSLLIDLAISMATATPFLGKFPVVRPLRVGFFSGESGHAAIQKTALRVCQSKGLDTSELGNVFWGFALPQLSQDDQLAELSRVIKEYKLDVVIIDPLYLCLLSGTKGRRLEASNLFDMGPLLLAVTQACLKSGATPLLAHHFRKGRESPYDPPELEDTAYAGIQEFARQWLLVGRREKYKPGSGTHRMHLVIGGSVGHQSEWALDVEEGTMDEQFNGRHWAVTVRPAAEVWTETKEKDKEARTERAAENARVKDEAREKGDAQLMVKLLGFLKAEPDRKAAKRRLRDLMGCGDTVVGRVATRAEMAGYARFDGTRYEWVKDPLEGPL